MKKIKVLALLDTKYYYDRQVLNGIKSQFDILQKNVQLTIDSASNVNAHDNDWDYIFADYDREENQQFLKSQDKPAVAIVSHTPSQLTAHTKFLIHDSYEIAKLAISEFISKGIKNVAFFADNNMKSLLWTMERNQAFSELALKNNLNIINQFDGNIEPSQLPLGILCASDNNARVAINLCLKHNLNIPKDIYIIGVDCDDTEKELSPIPFPSIVLDPLELGKRCVDIILNSKDDKVFYSNRPSSISMGLATDIVQPSSSNDIINKAIYYIHNHYHKNIKVPQVLEHCRVSRKTLDKLFQDSFDQSVHQYIHELRISRAKKLLSTTSDSIENIALQCGFLSQHYFHSVFKKSNNITPFQFRKEHIKHM